MQKLTDQEIVEGLLRKNNEITQLFFGNISISMEENSKDRSIPFRQRRPCTEKTFKYAIVKAELSLNHYNELVNELYLYLMKDEGAKLKTFRYESSFNTWLTTVAVRFFMRLKISGGVIEDISNEVLYEKSEEDFNDSENKIAARMDLESLFKAMRNKRYVEVIKKLILEEADPSEVAEEMGIKVDNLYNIKRRAMAALTEVALKDKKLYVGKEY